MDKDVRLKGWMFEAFRRIASQSLDSDQIIDQDHLPGLGAALLAEVESLARTEARGDKLKIVRFELTIEPGSPNLVVRAMREGEEDWVEVRVPFKELFRPVPTWG